MHLEVLELQKQVAELRKHLKTAQPRGEPSSRKQAQREVGAGHARLPPSSPPWPVSFHCCRQPCLLALPPFSPTVSLSLLIPSALAAYTVAGVELMPLTEKPSLGNIKKSA